MTDHQPDTLDCYEWLTSEHWADSLILGATRCSSMDALLKHWRRWEQEIMAHERVDEIKSAFTRRREELER